jgi:phosphoribosylformylglycinamidine synthase
LDKIAEQLHLIYNFIPLSVHIDRYSRTINVTLYQIEVRTISERHDGHVQRLAREILELPVKHLPSLGNISTSSNPFTFRTTQLYRITGQISKTQIEKLTQNLLIDPVVQEASITTDTGDEVKGEQTEHIVDVFFHPGVTDTLAESVLTGAQMLDITGLEHVETGQRYLLDGRLSEVDTRAIAQALLYNPVIQDYQLYLTPSVGTGSSRSPHSGTTSIAPSAGTDLSYPPPSLAVISPIPTSTTNDDIPPGVGTRSIASTDSSTDMASTTKGMVSTIPISTMNDEQLLEVSKAGLLSLNPTEMRAIQQHYRKEEREPTDVELETLAQTWSEHCSHKTFKATINYHELDLQGHELTSETIDGLLKSYIMKATEQIKPDWLVSAFSDNAGIIRFTDTHDIAFKVETHNHPSAIEPFGGANTGVGGVIRDVVGVSAQPLACTDVLCFGPQDTSFDDLPAGILTPGRIANGVVNGVRDYGNKMGIPTVNGAVLYHPGYIYNPLVFCGCLGILPHGSHPNQVQPGDLIVVLGGRTGRDGIHGATFSSGEMSSEINAQAGTAVQIGAPITEKKVTDVIIQARDRQLYHAITDCGAGGFSSAIGEMGSDTGVRVELADAPLKYQGLKPWEIWLSEAQERMVLAVPVQHQAELLALCEIEEVEVSILGTFTDDKRLVVTYQGQLVADLDMYFLHKGNPRHTLEAQWVRPVSAGTDGSSPFGAANTVNPQFAQALGHSFAPTLLALLRHPDIASKESIVRRYDHEVQGGTILKPLVGRSGNGPGDAAALQPILDYPAGTNHDTPAGTDLSRPQKGIILSNGINPLYGKIDPYHMAINAVDEALRNLTAVGGDISHTALLDNFCWGNPNDPEQLGSLVRAVKGCYDAAVGFGTPFISGKDSLNNEYRTEGRRLPVIPTLLISAVGVIEDAARTVDMALKTPGNLLYLLGSTGNELAGSHYTEVIDQDSFADLFPDTQLPQVNIPQAHILMKALGETIRLGLVRSCHDLSEGGLAVAAAEMSLAGLLGANIDVSHIAIKGIADSFSETTNSIRLFSESTSRFIVEITPEQLGAFEKYIRTAGIKDMIYIGTVSNTTRFVVQDGDTELINLQISELQEAWKGDLT